MAENNQKITLTAAESVQMDVGRNIARVSTEIMDKFNIRPGDVIEIKGKNKTVASVWRARPEDGGLDIIRLDGNLRNNAGTSLGEQVEVQKVEAVPAEAVTISPVEQVRFTDDPTEFFLQKLIDKPLVKGQRINIDVMGTQLHYVVTNVSPNKVVIVHPGTKLTVSDKVVKPESMKCPEVSYEDIGGLQEEIDKIREMVELPMKHPEVFERLGIGAPKGVLLTGPPGTGKTLLAKAVASETDSQFYSIAGPEIMSKYYGESEKQLRDVFEEAENSAPSIVFIDELDSIAPKRGEGKDQAEKRVVSQLLTVLDGLQSRGKVVVIAATNRPDDIDEALRRPGRFDREIGINPPNEYGRKEILQIHTRGMPLGEDIDLENIADKTLGFTGADLEVLCKEAALKSLKPYIPSLKQYDVKVPTNVLERMEVKMEHFEDALKEVEPSAMREVLINKPKTKWEDIGGLDEVKKQLQDTVELPLKNPELFKKAGISTQKGILLSGPPGTGKTLLAKAIANEANANFIAIKGPELVSKWVGESEKRVREIFSKARQVAPTIIFFDEFDSISKVRGGSLTDSTERIVNQLLTELDGVEELGKVTVIAATNRADLIDPSLLRPGRFELKIEIGKPDKKAREQILKIHAGKMPLAKDVKLSDYIEKTNGWTGADLESLAREAGLNAVRQASAEGKQEFVVTNKNFYDAFNEILKRERKDGGEINESSATRKKGSSET
ncbi:MAG: CDC48 family AAA ATPase [Nanoarchaeota archaeon]